ncbi:MAG: PQQ-binding-like beta-propeller repeat protein, partial [Planctomycetes bacterium]|nr:PQQ-binding-like beta-propeller repeat protein [Planctomycetota bacterium]
VADKIIAVQVSADNTSAKQLWKISVPGTVGSMIAADDRLFVSTTEGGIYCYSAKGGAKKAKVAKAKKLKHAEADGLCKTSAVDAGYAIVLGASDADFLQALAAQTQLRIVAIDKSEKNVTATRAALHAVGLNGHRVHVLQGDPNAFSFPSYMANLIVSDGSVKITGGLIKKHWHAVRPYGGMFAVKASSASSLSSAAKSLKAGTVVSKKSGAYQLIIRDGAIPGAGDWTQTDADAGNRMSSDDTLVRMPLRLLWYGGDADSIEYIYHHAMPPRPQVAAGQMYISTVGGMSAIDIYTGRLLWQKDLENIADTYGWLGRAKGVQTMGDFYASTSDSLYAASASACFRLDAKDGSIMKTIKLPKSSSGNELRWMTIRILGDDLIATAVDMYTQKLTKKTVKDAELRGSASSHLLVFDRKSGKLKWQVEAEQAFPHMNLAAGGGKLYCVDRLPSTLVKFFKQRGNAQADTPPVLKAFDLKTGKELWSQKDEVYGGYLRYSQTADTLISCTQGKGGSVKAYAGASGKLLWSDSKGRSPGRGVVVFNDVLAMAGTIFDLKSGAKQGKAGVSDNMSCTDITAGAHLAVSRYNGTFGFSAMDDGKKAGNVRQFTGTRPSCHNNAIPAGGVLTAPNVASSCICNYHNQTSMSFIHGSK